jgi:carbonic anhydrase
MHKNRGVKTGQLDERIDNTKVQIEHACGAWCGCYFTGPQYQGIANTIVQLFRRSTSGVIAASQPIRSDERLFEKRAWPHGSPVRRNAMSIIDKALEANRNYAKSYDPTNANRPAPKIVVVTCMDPRLSDLPAILGLPRADIDVIRTGGPAVTDDVLGELVVSNRVLGTTEIMLLNHTGCGFTTFTDDDLNKKLSASTGDASPAPMRFFSYKDPEQHTREQIKKVRSHPWIAKEVPVRGFIFDMETGLLKEVHQAAKHTA